MAWGFERSKQQIKIIVYCLPLSYLILMRMMMSVPPATFSFSSKSSVLSELKIRIWKKQNYRQLFSKINDVTERERNLFCVRKEEMNEWYAVDTSHLMISRIIHETKCINYIKRWGFISIFIFSPSIFISSLDLFFACLLNGSHIMHHDISWRDIFLFRLPDHELYVWSCIYYFSCLIFHKSWSSLC